MAKKKSEVVELRPIELQTFKVRVVGDSPLIMHAWSAKAKRDMLEKQMGFKSATKKEPKNPIEDFVASMYWLTPMPDVLDREHVEAALNDENVKFGFPVTAFKEAAISAAYRSGISSDKVSLQGAFFVMSEYSHYYGGDLVADFDKKKINIIPNTRIPAELVEIKSDIPVMREDMVKISKTTDIRYRGQFDNWSAELKIGFNASLDKADMNYILNLLNLGGFSCGAGEWRIEKGGSFGRFHVEIIK